MRSGQNATLSVAALPLDVGVDPVGGAGKERRAQDQKLAVAHVRQQRVDAILDDAADRIEELVDRRADGDDHRALGRNLAGLAGEEQPLVGQRLGQQFVGAALDERHAARPQRVERIGVEVVDVDGQSLGRERQHQRHADMAGAADHGQVGGLRGHRAGGSRTFGDIQGFSPMVRTNGRNARMKFGANSTLSIAL